MIKIILSLLIVLSTSFMLQSKIAAIGNEIKTDEQKNNFENNYLQNFFIDQQDSVILDLSMAIVTANSIEVPVSILSDDSVFALDFSFQYYRNYLLYDTIVDLTTYMVSSSFYNIGDSTVRFTSYGTQSYGNGTALVAIRFNYFNGIPGVNDFYSLTGYLNGDPCSIIVKGMLPTNLKENEKVISQFDFYPSPAQNSLIVKSCVEGKIKIINLNGKEITGFLPVNKDQETFVDIYYLPEGTYYVYFSNELISFTKKLVVLR